MFGSARRRRLPWAALLLLGALWATPGLADLAPRPPEPPESPEPPAQPEESCAQSGPSSGGALFALGLLYAVRRRR